METTTFTEKVISGLKKATIELEDFRVQAALGKAEAKDKYEETKKKFSDYLHTAKFHLASSKKVTTETSEKLDKIFNELQLHLTSGEATNQELFDEQRKKITSCVNDLKKAIEHNNDYDEHTIELLREIETLNIKLDILHLKYGLKKLDVQQEFEVTKKDLQYKLKEINERLEKKEGEAKALWGHFKDEFSEAFTHMKKAFTK